MKLTVDFSALHRAVAPLGSPVSDFTISNRASDWVNVGEHLIKGLILGQDIDLKDIDGSAGILNYKGYQVMLYIPDQGYNIGIALADGKHKDARKIHVAECSTLENMRQIGRFGRYDVISRIDGKFPVFGINPLSRMEESGETDLGVCKNCLTILNYKGYEGSVGAKKAEIFKNFSFEVFFEDFSSYFKSLPSNRTKAKSSYTSDWAKVSGNLRAELNFTCEQCGVKLSENPKLLHVHHINGVKSDNSRQNLRALCADCHKKQPHHEHLYVSNEDTLRINEYRREQHKFDVFDYGNVRQYADSALDGLLIKCQAMRLPGPELGIAVNDNNKMISIDLCWPRAKVAVLINMDSSKLLQKNGWSVFSAFEALSRFDVFQKAVR